MTSPLRMALESQSTSIDRSSSCEFFFNMTIQQWVVYFTSNLLTQNLHPTPSTQQAEQASFTHEKIPRRASQFFPEN
jgi:hypothetical protein